MNNLCHCGRTIPTRFNSTIKAKECPSCTYRTAVKVSNNKTSVKKERKPPVKWRDKPTHEMINYVQGKIVNTYIRERDNTCFNGKSISDRGRISDAGHYYSVGSSPSLRFNCQNIHGQSKSGNMFKSGDLLNYRKGLINRYGCDYVNELDDFKMLHTGKALDRLNVILIAETYLYLTKFKIWVFRHVEFEKYKFELINGKKDN
jgi:hypothetical protein